MRRLGLLLLLLAGCGNQPYCSDVSDATGRALVMCGAREAAICDHPGEEARFEDDGSGIVLVGGERAGCSAEDTVSCPPGTEGEAYCLFNPSL